MLLFGPKIFIIIEPLWGGLLVWIYEQLYSRYVHWSAIVYSWLFPLRLRDFYLIEKISSLFFLSAETKIGIYKCVRVHQNVTADHQSQNCDSGGQIASPRKE